MEMGFWKKQPKPFFALAPMADVTDAAFRRVIAKYGKFDVMWTEFVSADGLVRAAPEGKKKLMKDLIYTEDERPIVVQLFSSNPEYMKLASKLVAELGFDGIDINMGCPDKTIEKQGAGAALIKNSTKARELIRAAKEGIMLAGKNIPVSVKTRVGFNKVELETWIPELLEEGVAALTVHARTRKEMSKVPARWEHVRRAREIRDEMNVPTKIIGNGDVKNKEEGMVRVVETGCDGVMIGRGIFGNPWLMSGRVPDLKERLKVLTEHTKLFEEILGDTKSFALMKKHYKAYIEGFDGAKELRMELMNCEDALEVEKVANLYLEKQGLDR